MGSMPNHLLAVLIASILAGQAAGPSPQSPADPAGPPAPPPAASAPADPPAPAVSVGADLLASSAFVWRGFVDIDSLVVQPDVWVKWRGLTVSSWINVARHNDPEDKPLSEHDLTVDYSVSRGKYTMSAGWINYAFLDIESGSETEGGRWSNEVYVGVSREGPLTPSVRVFQDFQQGSGTYVSLGVQHAFAVGRGLALAPAATLGYNHHLYTEYSAFSDAVVSVKGTVPTPVKHLALQPFVAYSLSLDHRIARDRFYWGLGAVIAGP